MVCQTAEQSTSNAKRYTTCTPGQCLAYTRGWLEIPSRDGSAITAWNNALGRHSGDRNPPRGAPVFWSGGSQGYGHIALALNNRDSDDAQMMRSTDMQYAGQVSTGELTWIADHWSMPYLGWAEGINGIWIPYLKGWDDKPPPEDWRASGDVYVSKLHRKQKNSDSVGRMVYRLREHPHVPKKHQPPNQTSNYSKEVAEAVQWWQKNVAPNVGGPKDGKSLSNPQANTLFGTAYHVIEK